ncbi:hypothetical protein JR316_0004186 [Psilocybe cubensis]|uniref:BTB domain-containing protein n=2 Tax=Psilocybe cubensis TaxID=181762 RepID=A0A8H7XZY8_PSICU|nr:hypothetical protein JR316_0004186 [Psilocybe cubensis]KAH9482091.1 hypothetical protein JR316_0004186 [Psilocybe cubensis]
MDFAQDHGSLSISVEFLQSALDTAMLTWREDLEDALPPFIWETVARERSKSEISDEGDRRDKLGTVSVNAIATTDSYERFFPNEPLGVGKLRDYLDSFPSESSHSFNLLISSETEREIMGLWTSTQYSNLILPFGKGITDQYTGKRVLLRQMSTTKIRNDLYFLLQWRLFSDMQIVVPASHSRDVDDEGRVVCVFPCHKSILAARSPYFRDILLSRLEKRESAHQRPQKLFIVPLPSPPFNPVTVDFTLRFIYTGLLQFPLTQFTADYSTTVSLYRASQYLRIPTLQSAIVSYTIADMLHGCFSAPMSASSYARLIDGKWKQMVALGGCSCRHCARRAPRILAFAMEPDIQDLILERGTRRALVGMFGPQWCTQELGSMPAAVHSALLESLNEMITPRNALALLFAAETALLQLDESAYWHKSVRMLILSCREQLDHVICQQSRPSFYCDEWTNLITNPMLHAQGVTHTTVEDERRATWILDSLARGVTPQNASTIYQTLTWFTEAQVPLENQNERVVEMMAPFKQHLVQMAVQTHRLSVISSASSILEPIDPAHRSLVALDLSDASVYSYPSSRTMSTEYGIYYTRLAISQETVERAVAFRRRRSWDTISTYTELQEE